MTLKKILISRNYTPVIFLDLYFFTYRCRLRYLLRLILQHWVMNFIRLYTPLPIFSISVRISFFCQIPLENPIFFLYNWIMDAKGFSYTGRSKKRMVQAAANPTHRENHPAHLGGRPPKTYYMDRKTKLLILCGSI